MGKRNGLSFGFDRSRMTANEGLDGSNHHGDSVPTSCSDAEVALLFPVRVYDFEAPPTDEKNSWMSVPNCEP